MRRGLLVFLCIGSRLDERPPLALVWGCPSVGVLRSVVLRLSQPIQPEDIRLDYTLG